MLINELRMVIKDDNKLLSCAEIHSIDLYNNEFVRIVEYCVNMEPILERVSLDDVIILLNTGKKDDIGQPIFVGDTLEIQADFVSTPQGSGYTLKRIDVVRDLEYFYTEIYPNAESYRVVGNICDNKKMLKTFSVS